MSRPIDQKKTGMRCALVYKSAKIDAKKKKDKKKET